MKSIDEMSQAELAAYVHDHLRKTGIDVVLSGGAAVGIYSQGEYVSKDIDFVNTNFTRQDEIEGVAVLNRGALAPFGNQFQSSLRWSSPTLRRRPLGRWNLEKEKFSR